MKINYIDKNNLEKLNSFYYKSYPEKRNHKEILRFWLSKSKEEYTLSTILSSESKEIWGQLLSSSMSYYYSNQIFNGTWMFDYIISEEKRKDGYGIDLLQFALQKRKVPIFATGSGPLALKIELRMGFKLIGELRKYVGISNPLFLPSSLFRGVVSMKKYPATVNCKAKTFKLTTVDQLPDFISPFNSELLEFGRDNTFIKWRYFSDLHSYAFYKQEEGDDYFVVRTIVKRGITCLVLVDYRCSFSEKQNFVVLLKAVKKVASLLKLSVIISGSSLRITDEVFENKRFRSIGRPRPIITTEKYKEEKQRIENRGFVFATLADSDGEINW
jgi:hypothetical protein